MAHAHCTLVNQDYKRTLRIFNTYSFSTATLIPRTRLGVTLYVHCPSGFCNYKLFNLHLPVYVMKYFANHFLLNSTVSRAVTRISLTLIGFNVCGELINVV